MEIFLPVKNRKALKNKSKQSGEERIIEKCFRSRKCRFNENFKNIIGHVYKTQYLNVPKKTKKMIEYLKDCNLSLYSIIHKRRSFVRHRCHHLSTKYLLKPKNHIIPDNNIIIDTCNILKKEKILKEGKEIVKEKYSKIDKKILRIANGMNVETSVYNCSIIEDVYY